MRANAAGLLLLLAACGGPDANVQSADPYERFLGVRENEGRRDAVAVAEVVRLLEDPHYLVVTGALATLAEMGQKEFLQHAVPLLSHKHFLVRREACLTIGRLGNPLGVPYLLKAVEDPEGLVRRGAVKALGMFREAPEARRGLLKAMGDAEAGVVLLAHETLQQVTGRFDIPRSREAWAEILK